MLGCKENAVRCYKVILCIEVADNDGYYADKHVYILNQQQSFSCRKLYY